MTTGVAMKGSDELDHKKIMTPILYLRVESVIRKGLKGGRNFTWIEMVFVTVLRRKKEEAESVGEENET